MQRVSSCIDDRSILAILVGAIKALYAQVQEYFARTERLPETREHNLPF